MLFRSSATDAMNNDASSDDLFSASTSSKGNKKLKYPIGLFTGDEASYMGYYGKPGAWYASGVKVYLIENSSGSGSTSSPKLWTMSPGGTVSICGEEECSTKYQVVEAYVAEGTGLMSTAYPPNSTYNRGVKPVISLKSCVTWASGNGTANSPYKVSISSSCSSAVN